MNHRLPSGPAVIPLSQGRLPPPTTYSVIEPPVVLRPILPSWPASVNHRLPSGPGAIAVGRLTAVGIGNSLILIAA